MNAIFVVDSEHFMLTSYVMSKLFIINKSTGDIVHRINNDFMFLKEGRFQYAADFQQGGFFEGAHD